MKNEPISVLEEALARIDKHKKTAYKPITKSVKSNFDSNSKFGGFPYLRNEEDWPICPNCKNHKHFFLQLEMEKLPESSQSGLLQLFYCTTEEPHCESVLEAFFPFSEAISCRKIEVNGDSARIVPDKEKVFEEKIVTDWKGFDDFPHIEEYADLGLVFTDEIEEIILEKELRPTIQGDKFSGFPYWVQSVEYPKDRTTESRMDLLFQLDSEDNLPYMFGDMGIGHITQSPDNEMELTFAWACY